MIAGLPKARGALTVLVYFFLPLFTWAALSEETTAEPTLDELIARIEGVSVLTAEDQATLVELLTSSLEGDALTTTQAAAILDAVSLETLTAETAAFAVEALEITLASVLSGRVEPEAALAALADAVAAQDLGVLASTLAALATPPGILQAIGNAAVGAGLDEASLSPLLDLVRSLIGADVPPGIVVRVTKHLLDETTDLALLTADLTSLGALIEAGTPPGRAANEIAELGQERERERNENEHHEDGGQAEEEEEKNGNGPSHEGKGGKKG